MEGLLLFDLSRLEQMLPPELNVANLAGRTTRDLGEQLVKHATQCTDRQVAAYLEAGGNALIEVAPQRNAVLHARPATDDLGRTRLYRWRLPEAHFIDDTGSIVSSSASTNFGPSWTRSDHPLPR